MAVSADATAKSLSSDLDIRSIYENARDVSIGR